VVVIGVVFGVELLKVLFCVVARVRFELLCGDGRVVWRGLCDIDRCDPFPTAACVASSLSFMINPPSTNSRIICRRKDHGGCGCSHRWPWCFRFCLFGGRPPRSLSVRYLYSICVVEVVMCGCGGGVL
jgi:hypothetical protein